MKKLLAVLLAILLTGCANRNAEPTTKPSETMDLPILGEPGDSVAAVVLGDIWAQYEPQERFAVYGGMLTHPVADAPGDLDLQHPEEWAVHCHFPTGCLQLVKQGAAMTHLLNENLFTAVAVQVTDAEAMSSLTGDWRYVLQHSAWAAVAPERLLLAQVGQRYLVMAMGSKENLRTFRQKLLQAYPAAEIVCDEPITC